MTPTEICIDIYGECRCVVAGRQPCDAMVALAENGETARDELLRMEQERIAAADEDKF